MTEKSVSKIYKKAREERTRRVLERIKERNTHGFLNRGEDPRNISGIYRWVDKYYEARLINYGKRLMIEFIVPEPASFYLQQTEGQAPTVSVKKPVEPKIQVVLQNGEVEEVWLRPQDISDQPTFWEGRREAVASYLYWASLYGAEVAPPPLPAIQIGKAYGELVKDGDDDALVSKASSDFVVPTGYVAQTVFLAGSVWGTEGEKWFRLSMAGADVWVFDEPKSINETNGNIGDVETMIPVSIHGLVRSYSVNIVAHCVRKVEVFIKWQEDTYNAIMRAYEHRLAEYNEAVAAATIRAGVDIQGRNPGINRRIESEELRRSCLRLLTNDMRTVIVDGQVLNSLDFEAVRVGLAASPYGYEEADPARALL